MMDGTPPAPIIAPPLLILLWLDEPAPQSSRAELFRKACNVQQIPRSRRQQSASRNRFNQIFGIVRRVSSHKNQKDPGEVKEKKQIHKRRRKNKIN
jgi:hypothetical protein